MLCGYPGDYAHTFIGVIDYVIFVADPDTADDALQDTGIEIFDAKNPFIVGLTKDPKRLVEIRRQRLRMIEQDENTDYVDLEMVSKEINDARRLFAKHEWHVINVSRKSIEETAATIIKLYQEHQGVAI